MKAKKASMQKQYNEIERSKEFDTFIQAIAKSYTRLNELDEAIDHAMMRFDPNNPELKPIFISIGNSRFIYVMDDVYTPQFPQLRIVFEYIPPHTIVLIAAEEL